MSEGFSNLLDYPLGTHTGIVVLGVPSTFVASQTGDTLQTFVVGVEPVMRKGALAIVEPGRFRIRQPEQS